MGQFEGKLVSWNSEKGFGFISPKSGGGGKDIFVHILDLRCKSEAPFVGDTIFYNVKKRNDGKLRACDAYVDGAKNNKPKASARLDIFGLIFITFPFLLSLYIIKITYYPLIAYSVATVVCFFAYFFDKRRAIDGSWRVAESTLHLLELIGGWPGALLAQQTLRHKTRKLPFQLTFWVIVALHFIGWADYLYFDLSLFSKLLRFIDVLTKG